MNFTAEDIRIIQAARPIWNGYLKSQTINTGQREIGDLRALYEAKFAIDGKNPEWSGGCIDCIVNCMRRVFDAAAKHLQLEAALFRMTNSQQERKPRRPAGKKAKKASKKK
jgi:hypothetical protein